MTDIVERLRSLNADFLHEEAADEIERLWAALRHMSDIAREREAAARREGIEAAAAIAANWNIPSVDKPAAIRALLKEPGRD